MPNHKSTTLQLFSQCRCRRPQHTVHVPQSYRFSSCRVLPGPASATNAPNFPATRFTSIPYLSATCATGPVLSVTASHVVDAAHAMKMHDMRDMQRFVQDTQQILHVLYLQCIQHTQHTTLTMCTVRAIRIFMLTEQTRTFKLACHANTVPAHTHSVDVSLQGF